MTDTPQDAPDYHEPELEALIGTQLWLGDELARGLEIFPGSFDTDIVGWRGVKKMVEDDHFVHDCSEALIPALDLLHKRVLEVQSMALTAEQREIVDDVLDSWAQASQDESQEPFGEFE